MPIQPIRFALLALMLLVPGITAQAQQTFTLSIPNILPPSDRPVVQTPDGGFVLLFNTYFGLSKRGLPDTVRMGLAKFSPDGLIEWSRYVDIGVRRLFGRSLLPTPDGGFIAVAKGVETNGNSLYAPYQSDIALFRFNAHGYLLWAKRYAEAAITDPQDAILLDDGNMLISASLKDHAQSQRAEAALIVVDLAGEVIRSNRYPAMACRWRLKSQLHPLKEGNVALLGSFYDTATHFDANMTCILNPDGTAREGVLLNVNALPYTANVGITDILSNDHGGNTLLAHSRWYQGESESFAGMIIACDQEWNPLWIAEQTANASLLSEQFLPTEEKGFRIIGQTHETSPLIVIQDLDEYGKLKEGLQTAPFPIEVSQGEDYYEYMRSHSYPTDDQGELILGIKSYNEYPDPDDVGQDGTDTTLIVRLPFDFTPCTGEVEHLNIDDTGRANSEGDVTPVEKEMLKEATGAKDELSKKEPPLLFSKLDVRPVPLVMAVRDVVEPRVTDFRLDAKLHCRENAPTLSSVRRNGEESKNTAILLSPNSLRIGEKCAVTFRLDAKATPEITLLNVATGQSVRHLESNAVTWSPATGQGSASLPTDGLSAGVYLVRVRSGERQLTAKLEVR